MNKENDTAKQRLGEILVQNGLITEEQLKKVLNRQTQVGGHLGSILVNMGFITIDKLIEFLSKKAGVPGINLFELNIDPAVINLLPLEKINAFKILPVAVDKNILTLAMINPQDFLIIGELEFTLGKKIKPVIVPHFMMEAAFKSIISSADGSFKGTVAAKLAEAHKETIKQSPKLIQLLRYLAKSRASDMLLTAGAPPSIRITNELKRLAMVPLVPADCERYARELMADKDWDIFRRTNEHDFTARFPKIGRFRVNVYRQRNSVSIALRPIYDEIPSLKELNLPEWVKEFALKPHGLILITGPAGHGKSTTLSAMIDIINTYRKCNIVTLEDPIEYLHKHKMSNINQREVGRDTVSFYEGIRHIFRQSPDVIMVGEMRDRETFEIALLAADTGHLVLSTVHSDNSTSVIERVINMFPPYQHGLIRMMLADSLLLSISQRLIPLKNGPGRILAVEKLINTFRIKKLIREEKTHQIRSQMQAGTEDYTSIDIAVADLCNQGLINHEDGLIYIEDKQFFNALSIKFPDK
ncbi:MAG: PilT/PilU family type 4a pilus ATPase [Desulfobacterales bacterium]|nr:PilT/PilU family type 4a pilus ATPase [Desulfobacterales bacterium]